MVTDDLYLAFMRLTPKPGEDTDLKTQFGPTDRASHNATTQRSVY